MELQGGRYDDKPRAATPEALRERVAELELELQRQQQVERTLRDGQTRLREALENATRLEAVGRLADGVVHDFNNLLGVIQGYSELVLRKIEPQHPERPRVQQILEAARRAAALTRQLLAVSRRPALDPQVLDLGTVLEEMAGVLERLVREDVALEVRSDPQGWPVKADRSQIELLLLDLVASRRASMPNGGSLAIAVANRLVAAPGRPELGLGPGRHVTITVHDSGGADTEGGETGFGSAHRVARQSGGAVETSHGPDGSTCTVYLPALEEVSAAQALPAPSVPAARPQLTAGETVLLVEDDEPLRSLICELLEGQGREVLAAANGSEALCIASEHHGPIHLLLTDIVMPGMNGRHLAASLKQRRAETRVLYMSGYAAEAAAPEGVDDDSTPLLQKPFTGDALARGVREALVPMHA